MLQHAASRSRQSQPPLLPPNRGGVGLQLEVGPTLIPRFSFQFHPENFFVRKPELFTGQREVLSVQRGRGGRRGQGGGWLELRKGRVGAGSLEARTFLLQIYGIASITGFTTFLRRSCCCPREATCRPRTALRRSCSRPRGCWKGRGYYNLSLLVSCVLS